MSIEAMKQALEALSYVMSHGAAVQQAKDILLEAIEQAEKQEPVAWVLDFELLWPSEYEVISKYGDNAIPLYTAPPQREWQGLTDEEIMDACSAVWASHPIEVGHVVQDLLKEKNA